MRIHRRIPMFIGVVVAVACAPIEAGPELPRPPQTRVIETTTTIPTTTTTLDELAILSRSCPGEVCLLYTLSPDARWSDGQPVSAADFVATVDAHQNPLASTRDPAYDVVAAVDEIDPGRVRVALDQPYGAWQGLFSRVLAAHADGLEPGVLPSSGPFVFEEWVPGDRIIVERNDSWWSGSDPITGDPAGTVERIEFVFIADTEELVDAVLSGEVDLAAMRPTTEILDQLSLAETVDYEVAPGPFWEHIDFHHEDELLSRDWVRKALDMAIDRQKILTRTIRQLDPTAVALNNTVWMRNTAAYESHYDDAYDPETAEQMLVDHGCTRPEEIYECDGQPMSFVWMSTNDDPDRQTVFESVSEDLAAIGVELIPQMRSPSAFVNRDVLFGGPDVWQFVNFSWRAGSDPSAADPTYFCGESDLNVNRYCSQEVAALVDEAATTMDPVERAMRYNEADRRYLEDLAVIPLYQKPELLVWSEDIEGPESNFTISTDLWNVASWTGDTTLIVALPTEPAGLDPLSMTDRSANRVLATMLYGAFGMDPSHQHVPVLIESVQILED